MNTTNTTIITLLRVALSGKAEILPTDVNWCDVIEVAAQHGVLAICFDALEILKKDSLNSKLSPLSSFPDMDNLMDWLGQTSYQETQYEHNWKVANQLAELWSAEGISATVLKGRSIAQYYPKPEHRYSCDLDVLIPAQSEWDKACQILETKGIKLVHEVYKEVEFTYNDVYVECHRYVTPCRGNNTLLNFEKYLRIILESEGKTCFEGSKLTSPPLLFTVMLFIEHALGDFLHGKLSLKHIVDWVVLRKQPIDQLAFDMRCKEFKFDRFVSLINALVDVIEGKVELSSLPQNYQDAFNEMFFQSEEKHEQQTWFQRRVGLFFVYLKNKKKFDQFGYCSMRKLLFNSMWSHFFDKEVRL